MLRRIGPTMGWFAGCVALAVMAGCTGTKAEGESKGAEEKASKPALSELVKIDKEEGKGDVVEKGDTVMVAYSGALADGTEFDANMDGTKPPLAIRVGEGRVIKGWDEGLPGMKVGGTRELQIPWSMGYGAQGNPPTIPARADLYFTVKLLGMVKEKDPGVMDVSDVKVGTGPAVGSNHRVKIHYVGTYLNGLEFENTRTEDKPFTFTRGKREIIPGLEFGIGGMEGLEPMKVGGIRKINIPPTMAFGRMGNMKIQGDQILVYEVEVLESNAP